MRRRPLLSVLLLSAAVPQSRAAAVPGAVAPGPTAAPAGISRRALQFPADHGAHPDTRTEWWYLTGHLSPPGAATPAYGFQLTFFRSRTGLQAGSSRFAARQLIAVHAALTDVRAGRLQHTQRLARQGFGIADAARGDTAVHVADWSLARDATAGGSGYRARLEDLEFGFDLRCQRTQAPLLQGLGGWSQKGPDPAQASHYYSVPQLAVTGRLRTGRDTQTVEGQAWLDHEWSETLLDPAAVGWDWIGMNLADGSALTVFRLRRADGSALYAGGSHRAPGAAPRHFEPGEVEFTAQRLWTSAATQAHYPVAWRLRTPVGSFTVQALLDAQEVDARASTGTIYWEGLAELRDATGQRVGLGYLELTGYAGRIAL